MVSKKWTIGFIAGILFLSIAVGTLSGQNFDPYASKYYDSYRQIRYWAFFALSISDYDYGSGDAKYLGLVGENSQRSPLGGPSTPLREHFGKEFSRVLKGDLPYFDTTEGQDQRFSELFLKYGKQSDFFNLVQAQESARRNALYGPKPAAVYCIILISRREFPVLYEIKISIVTNEVLSNYNGLEEKGIGFSTPEYIAGELQQAITTHLSALAESLKKVRNAKSE